MNCKGTTTAITCCGQQFKFWLDSAAAKGIMHTSMHDELFRCWLHVCVCAFGMTVLCRVPVQGASRAVVLRLQRLHMRLGQQPLPRLLPARPAKRLQRRVSPSHVTLPRLLLHERLQLGC